MNKIFVSSFVSLAILFVTLLFFLTDNTNNNNAISLPNENTKRTSSRSNYPSSSNSKSTVSEAPKTSEQSKIPSNTITPTAKTNVITNTKPKGVPRKTTPKTVAVENPKLFGNIIANIYSKGMPYELYARPYSPERTDTDSIPYTREDSSVDLSRFYCYSELENIYLKLAKSPIVDLYKIGSTADSRNIYSLQIGKGEKVVLLSAGVHSREVANPLFVSKFISDLLRLYDENNAEIVQLLNEIKIVSIPCVNPDGFDAALWGNSAVKNRSLYIAGLSNATLSSLKANANGVDLNRSFNTSVSAIIFNNYRSFKPITYPNIEGFAGHTLGSEAETQAMIYWFKNYVPSTSIYIDMHSRGRTSYANKYHLSDELSNGSVYLAEKVRAMCGYSITTSTVKDFGSGTDGTTTDFFLELASGFEYNASIGRIFPLDRSIYAAPTKYNYFKYKTRALTIETLGDKILDSRNANLQVAEWNGRNLFNVLLSLCKEAR